MFYTVMLNPTLEYHMQVDETTLEGVHQGKNPHFLVNGFGLQASKVFSDLGELNIMLGFCGGTVGDKIIRILDRRGIHNEFVTVSKESMVNVILHGKKSAAFVAPAMEITDSDFHSLLGQLTVLTSRDTALLIDSGICIGQNNAELQMAKIVRSVGSTFVYCSEAQQLDQAVLALGPQCAICRTADTKDLFEVCNFLLGKGAKTAAVIAPEAICLANAHKCVWLPVQKENFCSTEQFAAGLCSSKAKTIEEQLCHACACALHHSEEEITVTYMEKFLKEHLHLVQARLG